jgi:hypothetical protein
VFYLLSGLIDVLLLFGHSSLGLGSAFAANSGFFAIIPPKIAKL